MIEITDMAFILLGGSGSAVPPSTPPESQGTDWSSQPYSSQTGLFILTFTVNTPGYPDNLDLVIGASESSIATDAGGSGYSELSALVRFGQDGTVEAYDGSTYTFDVQANHQPLGEYEVVMLIDTASNTYSVNLDGVRIATDYAFRSSASSLGFLCAREAVFPGAVINFVSVDVTGNTPAQASPPSEVSKGSTFVSVQMPSDNVDLDFGGYSLFQDSVEIATGLQTNQQYTVGGLSPETSYNFSLRGVSFFGVSGPESSNLSVTTDSSGSGALQSLVSSGNITWTFDTEYEVGQYINGDYWVVGPITVTSISTGSLTTSSYSGSEINPSNGSQQGFTNNPTADHPDVYNSYNSALNVRSDLPSLSLSPGESLVSTHGRNPPSTSSTERSSIQSVGVLTCVASAPDSLAFRPPYNGSTKPVYLWDESIPGTWPTVSDGGTTGLSVSNALLRTGGVQLEPFGAGNGVGNDRMHQRDNMRCWGADIGEDICNAILCTFLETTSASDRRELLINITQIGIDNYYAKVNGYLGQSDSGGGVGVGRKAAVNLAGYIINEAMGNTTILDAWTSGPFVDSSFPATYIDRELGTAATFQEDSQLFVLTQSLRDAANNPSDYGSNQNLWMPGVFDGVPLGQTVWCARARSPFGGYPEDSRYAGETPQSGHMAIYAMNSLLGMTEAQLNGAKTVNYVDNAMADNYTTWGAAGTVAASGNSGFTYRTQRPTGVQQNFYNLIP